MIADPQHPAPRSTHQRRLRVALAHDWLVARRGGELVLDAIIQMLHQDQHDISRLYSMFDANIPITPNIDALQKSVSSLSSMPPSLRRWLLMRYPTAVRQLTTQLDHDHATNPIDLLISTHSSAIKAIEPPSPSIPHICYCHTPARYLWSQTSAYHAPGITGALRSLGLRTFAPSLKRWDKATAQTVTQFIANSTHTAHQIRQHYDRDSLVIHPPVRTNFYTQTDTPRNDTLLLVSALEPYKRVDLAIDAAAITDRQLIIVGSGSHNRQLQRHARQSGAKVQFLGQVTDQTLRDHYRSASAFLFPQIEDFGITAVEAQATGCPVVARRAGGALDTVIESQTGAFFDEPTAESIANAIDQLPSSNITKIHCRTNAQRFSEEVFATKFGSIIEQTMSRPQ